MRFANLNALHYLWFIFVLAVFYVWAGKLKKKRIQQFAQEELFFSLTEKFDYQKRRLKKILLFSALALSVFVFMRPQWGFHWQEVKRRGLDIIIAIDTSKSMLAQDVKPNRLERSKLAVQDLIKKLKGDRIGLIAFAGKSFLTCPLTVDYSGFCFSLDRLDVDTVSYGGTAISEAIREARKSFQGNHQKYKILVLITDGEDHLGDSLAEAKKAKEEGIKIFCIGIGTKEGEIIPITNENGTKTFLKDEQGNVVKTRLDENTLEKIALTTQGSYVQATGAEFGLDLIYTQKLAQMEKRDIEGKMQKRFEERFQIFLGIVLILLISEIVISEKKREDD